MQTQGPAQLSCPAVLQPLRSGASEGPSQTATTVELGTQGAVVRATQILPLGSSCQLKIQLPGENSLLVVALARVVRIEEETAGNYLMGFSFQKIEALESAEALERLKLLEIRALLETLVAAKGSDLHLTTGQPPIARVRGRLTPLAKLPALRPGEIEALVYGILTNAQRESFEKNRELDFAYSLSLDKRFRFNLHWQRSRVEAAIRVVPGQVAHWEELGIPPVAVEWSRKAHGLFLIVGPTGSGKTTTLNALVQQINEERDAVIIMLERPIEYSHQNVKAVIKQREVGSDTLSFAEAVRRALRQDPDVLVVGEVDDAETAQVVLNAAETGNLVMASFHAPNTVQAIDRFISLCPSNMRPQICFQLASCLHGVLTQHLLQKEDAMGGGVALATEVFVPTAAGRAHIRNSNLSQLYSVIETGVAQKMHTLESSIQALVTRGLVSEEIAQTHLALAGQKS